MALKAVDLNGSAGLRPLIVGIVFFTLAMIAVALRIISNRIGQRRSLHLDDYMICLALIFTSGNVFANMIGIVYGGIGRHTDELTEEQNTVYLKGLLANILLWATSLATIKISILLFYIRIFSIRKFRLAAYGVMTIVVLWWVSVVLEEFLLCKPFAYNWNQKIPGGKCADVLSAYIAAGVINLCTDLMVLFLPIPTILGLQLPVRNKIALTFVICLGFLVCIITCIRISAVVAYNPLDGTYSLWQTAVWSQLEPTLGIICACIPLMRPVLDQFILRRKSTTNDSKSRSAAGFVRTSTPPDIPLANSSAWAQHHRSRNSVTEMGAEEELLDNRVRVKTGWAIRHSGLRA